MTGKLVLYYNDLEHSPSDMFLEKDFGQVPLVLSQKHGLDLEYWISALRPSNGYDSFRDKQVRQYGKTMRRLPRRLDFARNIRLYIDALKDGDVTHLLIFPFTPITDFLFIKIAKWRNPSAKVILKLDANEQFLRVVESDWKKHANSRRRRFKQSYFYRALLDIADVVVCETSACEAILKSGFLGLRLEHKLAKTFSGVSERWLSTLGISWRPYSQRNSSIVVSGRLSAWVKHTDLIFEAGPPPPGWTIEFIGEIDEGLQRAIEAYRATDPGFDQRYRFHGMITDKRAYYDILMRSRALLMNSRGPEGFPNVYADAHFCGLFILTSDIASSVDATDNGRLGIIYERGNAEALRDALAALPERIEAFENDLEADRYRHAFIWEHSLDQPAIRSVFPGNSESNTI